MRLSWRRYQLQPALGAILMVVGIVHAFAQTTQDAAVQTYPSRPVRILAGGQPGTVNDVTARLIGENLAKLWGKPVIIENQPGAGGTIAADNVAKSAPDGHVLLAAGHSNLVLAQAIGKNLSYDPQRDFAPIGRIARVPFALAVNSNVPVHSVTELIEYAKAHPGQLTYATNGPGTMSQLSVELFTGATGTTMLAVPYKGVGSAIIDVVAGRVDMMLTDWVGLAPRVQSGALRLLGAAGARRLPAAPDIATIAEQGVPGYAVSGWYGLLAPAGTPPEILIKLSDALNEVRRMPDVRERLEQLGCEPIEDSPAQFRSVIALELKKYSEIARRVGIKAD